ncbi:MAG: LysR family transcriptional regulator [Candidimonas sp.]
MIDLRNLETFVWIAQLGSFRAAAEQLHTTQPGVSRRIALLERELGVRLFEREPSGVVLTRKGRELMQYAERMLRLRVELIEVARDKSAMRGLVRLGVAETLVHTWLSALIKRVNLAYPAVTLEIEVDTSPVMLQRLESNELDAAFVNGPTNRPNLSNVALSSYPMAWVAGPTIEFDTNPISLGELSRWPILTYLRDTGPHVAVRELFMRADLPNARIYGNASLSTIVRLTLDGIGVSAIPPVIVQRELKEERLRIIDVQAELPALNFTAVYPARPDSYVVERVIELARELGAAESHRSADRKPRLQKRPARPAAIRRR